MKRLDTYANKEETARANELAETARSTPVMAMSSAHALNDGGFSGQAWQRVYDYVDEIAEAHGLPRSQGNYSLDPSSGQFIEVMWMR